MSRPQQTNKIEDARFIFTLISLIFQEKEILSPLQRGIGEITEVDHQTFSEKVKRLLNEYSKYIEHEDIKLFHTHSY